MEKRYLRLPIDSNVLLINTLWPEVDTKQVPLCLRRFINPRSRWHENFVHPQGPAGLVRSGMDAVVRAGPGHAAVSGTSIVEGMRLAAEEANAQGGVNGKKVQLFEEDDEGLTTKAVTGARRLVESNKVIGISGSYISAAAIAATK